MSMHVSGALHVAETEVSKEQLIEALADAVMGAPHWRTNAQALLRKIAASKKELET
jgi:hypothetical protein